MRSQGNSAKLLVNNPILMHFRELEVLEKVAATADSVLCWLKRCLTVGVAELSA